MSSRVISDGRSISFAGKKYGGSNGVQVMVRDTETLDVVSKHDVGESAAVTTPPDMDGPVFGVDGDLDLACGGCGEWLVRGWDPHQKSVTSERDRLYIQCPKCRSFNLLQASE